MPLKKNCFSIKTYNNDKFGQLETELWGFKNGMNYCSEFIYNFDDNSMAQNLSLPDAIANGNFGIICPDGTIRKLEVVSSDDELYYSVADEPSIPEPPEKPTLGEQFKNFFGKLFGNPANPKVENYNNWIKNDKQVKNRIEMAKKNNKIAGKGQELEAEVYKGTLLDFNDKKADKMIENERLAEEEEYSIQNEKQQELDVENVKFQGWLEVALSGKQGNEMKKLAEKIDENIHTLQTFEYNQDGSMLEAYADNSLSNCANEIVACVVTFRMAQESPSCLETIQQKGFDIVVNQTSRKLMESGMSIKERNMDALESYGANIFKEMQSNRSKDLEGDSKKNFENELINIDSRRKGNSENKLESSYDNIQLF